MYKVKLFIDGLEDLPKLGKLAHPFQFIPGGRDRKVGKENGVDVWLATDWLFGVPVHVAEVFPGFHHLETTIIEEGSKTDTTKVLNEGGRTHFDSGKEPEIDLRNVRQPLPNFPGVSIGSHRHLFSSFPDLNHLLLRYLGPADRLL